MSRFLSQRFSTLTAYTPGEQPKIKNIIKLNSNELPYPPSKAVSAAVKESSENLNRYCDIGCTRLREALGANLKVAPEKIIMTNGSDEILNFAFMAYGDKPFAFPDISYGFYTVFCALHKIAYEEIPLNEELGINPEDYIGIGKNIVIANPNAPTGLALPLSDIERIVASNPDNIVIIDEAYIDFGGESAIGLIDRYENLMVTRTFSKSFALAGARLGFGIANEKLIADMDLIKFSTNPYNVNSLTQAAGLAAVETADYYMSCCDKIKETRAYTATALRELGFKVIGEDANFLFASSDKISGEELLTKLRERAIIVRHFSAERIKNYNRITIGTREQMETLIKSIKEIIS